MTKTAILVDEMNVIQQLRRLGIHGFNPWNAFYEALQRWNGDKKGIKAFYCANVPKEEAEHDKRQRFFNVLQNHNINVSVGTVVYGTNSRRIAKGVDVSLALDIVEHARNGVQDIFVCTGDADVVPAIIRAQEIGSRVHVVVSRAIPAKNVSLAADSVVRLEDVLETMAPHRIKLIQKERVS